MMGILAESFMVAARTDSFRHHRLPSAGTVENPARHDPERAWIEADQRRRRTRREARTRARQRADLRFWRGWRGPGASDPAD